MGWSKCSPIVITLKGNPKDVLAEVKKEAKKNEVTMTGDETKGTMKNKAGDIKGSYTVVGQKVTLNMSEKMFFGTCSDVKKAILKWFKGK